MVKEIIETRIHPTETELADFLSGDLSAGRRRGIEGHIASCGECLDKIVCAYDAVKRSGKRGRQKKGGPGFMKKINIYLAMATVFFLLSFVMPRYFMQFLAATVILGIKWAVDSKTTKMLIMIHEAWKKGGGRDVSRILQDVDAEKNIRDQSSS